MRSVWNTGGRIDDRMKLRCLSDNPWDNGNEYLEQEISALKAQNAALQKELDELKELYRWHKIADEGPPEEGGEYQVYGLFDENFDPEVCSSSYTAGGYYEPPTWWIYNTVVGAVYLEGCDITIERAAPITHWRKIQDDKPEQGEQ